MTPETSIYEYARQGLEISPDKTALWFYGKSISYRELFRCIDNAADNLYALGVRQGTVVTIHLPNCPQAAIAVYAVAKLGGICNMVHPQVPLKALQENMDFVESHILVTGDHLEQSHLLTGLNKLVVYALVSEYMGIGYKIGYAVKNRKATPKGARPFRLLTCSSSAKAELPSPSSLAGECVAYMHSSGTTGIPKTVMHSHESFNRWVENSKPLFRNGSNDGLHLQSVMSVTPFFHGSGLVVDLHRGLSCGGVQTLIARWNPRQAIKFIKKNKITNVVGVPAIYQSLLKYREFSGRKIASLTQCFVAGESVPENLFVKFNERVGKTVLFEAYGMSETVTACFVNSREHNKPSTSGYPLDNCFAAIMDENENVTHCGTGEILVSTNTMMLGYLKDTESTEKLKVDFDNKTWIRTGDIGTVDEDGYISFKDRIKNVIVRNGFNVFPDEIEELIRTVPDVGDTCVLGIYSGELKTEKIVAFIETPDKTKAESVKCNVELICKEALPRFSLPDEIHIVSGFPRNKMQKIDRNRIKSMYDEKSD